MYSYEWDPETRGYTLTTTAGKYISNELRPVFAEELKLMGMDSRFIFDPNETRPLLWAQKSAYYYQGEKVAESVKTQYRKPLNITYFFEDKLELKPVDVDKMYAKNERVMTLVVADAKRRVKELFDETIKRSDIAYIAFSGGKDSVVLLDICHQVLPLTVPVIYSDTDMELPSSIDVVWPNVQKRYSDREFIKVKARTSALNDWSVFGPPARNIRWCCAVHKSTPAVMYLKEKLNRSRINVTAFLGVRNDESVGRSGYDDISYGVKNASQVNCMPILEWGAHEIWLYILGNQLEINPVYRYGLSRVGCILCPESSGKHLWIVDNLFKDELDQYVDVVLKTTNKTFSSKDDADEFIGGLNWHARQSGVVLRDPLISPSDSSNDLTTTFRSNDFDEKMFMEWIKTIGPIHKRENSLQNCFDIEIPFKAKGEAFVIEGVSFICEFNKKRPGGKIVFTFPDRSTQDLLLPLLRSCTKKVVGCVGCRTCEAECVFGAIQTNSQGFVEIDSAKCVRCRSCYDISKACWRFRSMSFPETEKTRGLSVNAYKKFGLREKGDHHWISALVDMGVDFFPWTPTHPLGKKMVESARVWFIQAGLIDQDKKPLKLMGVFREKGSTNILGWELIWFNLANSSSLIRWYTSEVELKQIVTIDELMAKLANAFTNLEPVSIEGAILALKDMLTKSPLGLVMKETQVQTERDNVTDDGNVVLVGQEKRAVNSLTRRVKSVQPLSLLYCLYFIALKTGRSSFTVREMMTTEKDSAYVSPLTAFGFDADTFQRQCEGLRSRYSDYISTTFTHGNDEFEVYPEKHTLDDIIDLCLAEN